MHNISASTSYACSGCGACVAVCPKNAIDLQLDEAGFFKAFVNEALCLDCGLCQKVCTRFDETIDGADLRALPNFALQSKDSQVVHTCSSGGIAHELAVNALRTGKKVVGVSYDTETDQAKHIILDQVEQLPLIDGSKYLQSNSQEAFSQIVKELRENKSESAVIFGTPCQIAGLAKVAELYGIRHRMLLVELFCHGVPSYKLWEEQCRRIRKKLSLERFDSVQFRYKKDDWHSYCLKVTSGEKTYYGSREGELFYQVFFENVLLGDSCYNCRMRKEYSLADIRLGDYWGKKFQNRSDGVSAVFACTPCGQDALDSLKDTLIHLVPDGTDVMLSAQNMAGYQQQALHDKSMGVLREKGILTAVKTYRASQTGKQKLKRFLLSASAALPDGLRAKLRKIRR